jgi:hypothetical protein
MPGPPVMPQACILARYLEAEELVCRRMERTANADTPHGQEWHRVAEALLDFRQNHVVRCERCQPVTTNGAVRR